MAQGVEADQPRAANLSPFTQGDRLDLASIDELVEFRFAEPREAARFFDAQPVARNGVGRLSGGDFTHRRGECERRFMGCVGHYSPHRKSGQNYHAATRGKKRSNFFLWPT